MAIYGIFSSLHVRHAVRIGARWPGLARLGAAEPRRVLTVAPE